MEAGGAEAPAGGAAIVVGANEAMATDAAEKETEVAEMRARSATPVAGETAAPVDCWA